MTAAARARRGFGRALEGAGARLAVVALAGCLVAGCARPISFDGCTFDPTAVSPDVPAADFRVAVLAPPPSRDFPDPRIDIEIRPVSGEPERFRLMLARLEDDPRMVTRQTGRRVDYWRRYALDDVSHDVYRRYRATLAAPPGGAADVESTAWIVRAPIMPAGRTVREIQVRTSDAVGYDAVCRP